VSGVVGAIAVAGATGDLGGRIVAELLALGAPVRALARRPPPGPVAEGLTWAAVDYGDAAALGRTLEGCRVVVSALSGLAPVIVEAQGRLLAAAVAAGVPRFMPSDFAIDFRKLPEGSNRNLDLRRHFLAQAEGAPIRLTSVLNGAFMDMLVKEIPIIQHPLRRVLYWSHPEQPMDFTTIADTAAFAARVALDDGAPRWLNIVGERTTARGLAATLSALHGGRYGILPAGTLGTLGLTIAVARRLAPGGEALYPAWQGMQYMRNMFAGEGLLDMPFHNERYPGLRWTRVADVLRRDPRRPAG
jgi:nucleoside-diphosphate-sugar epimerase